MIFEKIEQHFAENKPFVAYRKPNKTKVYALFQEDDMLFTTENYLESGFVFAPFDDEENSVLIPLDKSLFLSSKVSFSVNFNDENLSEISLKAKEKHINLVSKGISAINDKLFDKVVLSRKEKVELVDFDLVTLFKRLLKKYSTAFVYVWFHPKVGLWLGATPETLLKINGVNFETMSLAGTRVFKGNQTEPFEQKEFEEQQFVTDYIIQKLSKYSDVKQKPLKTIKAGNLLHLQTKISGNLIGSFSELVKELHPTPAVCGLPKLTSKNFILENEDYNREFYTGFLGELNFKNGKQIKKTALFVNLRCMKIKDNNAYIYVGGGVTKDSNPTKEFEETVNKSSTIKSIL